MVPRENLKYSDSTGKVIGCAMAVHRALGSGFQEVVYQRALEIEMNMAGIGLLANLKCRFFTEIYKLLPVG